ncbi:MAG TPA: DUF488 family protein [Burkholderiales bacterium]|nr:DUF488 family protein [Burkholderiales bacterium]
MIETKSAYDTPLAEDGLRILVDRLWPRDLSKEAARIDLWMKEIAPSTELRKWFGHDPARWKEFVQRYFLELDESGEPLAMLIDSIRSETKVTLLHAASDALHNNALALRQYLESRIRIPCA